MLTHWPKNPYRNRKQSAEVESFLRDVDGESIYALSLAEESLPCINRDLVEAACLGEEEQVLRCLGEGADIDAVGGEYGTALSVAASLGRTAMVSLLLDRGADINRIGSSSVFESSALSVAASRGHTDTLKLLLNRGADINLVGYGSGYETALSAAAYKGHSEIVSILLDRGANINSNFVGNDYTFYTSALGASVSMRHLDVVSLLVDQGADINAVDGKYGTALSLAVFLGHTEVMSLLLDRGADINIVGGKYGTALATAVYRVQEQSRIHDILLLLDRGADINAHVGSKYGTALGTAAYRGNSQIVSLLLDKGANINAVGGEYGTALGTAAYGGHLAIVSLLLDRGANINAVGGEYGTALSTAARWGCLSIVLLLVNRGADVNAVGGEYGTALGAAAYEGHLAIVWKLLHRGADLNLVVGEYGTLLGSAVAKGDIQLVAQLLDQGCDIQAVGGEYGTALGTAAHAGHLDIAKLLLDRGADINIVGGKYGTALGTAAHAGHLDIAELLLDRGADVNTVGGEYGNALGTAAHAGHQGIVRLLLDRGADICAVVGEDGIVLGLGVAKGDARLLSQMLMNRRRDCANPIDINAVVGKYGTALGTAAYRGSFDIVWYLLDAWGVDIDINAAIGDKYGTVLGTAAHAGHLGIVWLFLSRGADINTVGGQYGTALGMAAHGGHLDIAKLLLDLGADINIVGGKYGTALGTAAHTGHLNIERLLLDRGADINIVGGKYGTALGTAAHAGHLDIETLLLDRGADINTVGGEFWTALGTAAHEGHLDIMRLLLDRGADIKMVGGKYGTVLGTAAHAGHLDIAGLLLDRGADINIIGGEYGTALATAAHAGHLDIVQFLLERGADINLVGGEHGTALAVSVATGNTQLVTMLLHYSADVFHVGGMYQTALGEYPTALDAVDLETAEPGLLALLEGAMKTKQSTHEPTTQSNDHCTIEFEVARWPPFPMPFTCTGKPHAGRPASPAGHVYAPVLSHTEFHPGAILTPDHANVPCRELSEEVLMRLLVALVDIHPRTAQLSSLQKWMRNDIRFFVSYNFDFGQAYAATRVGWKHFNDHSINIATQRQKWLMRAAHLDQARTKAVYMDSTGQEFIESPYFVTPRRVWDLRSNRVVSYRMLHAYAEVSTHSSVITVDHASALRPSFWAISHSWTGHMAQVETPINQYQWPVPVPKGVDVDDIRRELLMFGAEYVWVDVLCLRQQSNIYSLEQLKQIEWKIDVPTIGNIYRSAERLVRYFNGLGIPFTEYGWDNDRHWLRRAWTLQEIKNENTTFNGSVSRANVLNTRGKVSGKNITLRRALRPVLKLAAEADSTNGCSVYELAREMAKRCASQPMDKVAGLFYLLRPTKLPTYDKNTPEETTWSRCFHLLPFGRKVEILFDFPYRGGEQQWFPTWEQIMEWPERDPDCDHTRAGWQNDRSRKLLQANGEEVSILVCGIWAILDAPLYETGDSNEYEMMIGNKVFGFYSPYLSQSPLPPINPDRRFALAVLALESSYNWVVCEGLGEHDEKCTSEEKEEMIIRINIFKKVGVLKTDSCSELLMGQMQGNYSGLKQIDAIFV